MLFSVLRIMSTPPPSDGFELDPDGFVEQGRQNLVVLISSHDQHDVIAVAHDQGRRKQGLFKGIIAAGGGDVGASCL